MRHIGSLLAGLVVAPLAWVLIAAGQPRTEQTFERWATADSIYTGDVLGPLGLVLGAGLLVGLIVALRVSPLGPVVAGAFYLGVYAYAIREPVWVVDKLPQFSINGYRIDTVPPFANGTIALAGAILVTAALSRRRWQKWPAAVPAGAAVVVEEPMPVPESPAPAGVAAFTPNEVAPGPPPAVGEGPLWPSTVGAAPYAEFDSPLTREAMYAGLTPGTPEDLPRRTPPKRPTPNEQPPPETPRPDAGPAAGRTPATPLIPSPRHAAPAEGWPLDTWSTSPPVASPDQQPDLSDRLASQPTIEPTYQVPPATDLTQPVPPSDLTQPVPPPGQPTAGPASPQSPAQPSADRAESPQPPPQSPPSDQPPPVQTTAQVPGQVPPSDLPWLSGQPDQAGPPDQVDNPDSAEPPLRPVNPLAQRPVSPPPAGPPRPRPVNPLSTRPTPPTIPPVEPPAGPAAGSPAGPAAGPNAGPAAGPPAGPAAGPNAEPVAGSPAGSGGEASDLTQRLPGQATPADGDADEWPPDPPTASPWSGPPRPPQET